MKFVYIILLVGLSHALPAYEDEDRQGRSVIREFFGSIGMLRIIPRSCDTDKFYMGKGMCSLARDCENVGGAIAGDCERVGVCCVVSAVCGKKISVKRSWFINNEFPKPASRAYDNPCVLTIAKSSPEITQVRLDFDQLVLSRALDGTCNTDNFKVMRAGVDGMEESIPVLCGDNSGQHVYIDMPPGDAAEILVKVTVKDQIDPITQRGWRVHVTQLDDGEAAPQRCLQYYDENSSSVRSLNYDSSDANFVLNEDYDICFKSLKDHREEEDEKVVEEQSYNICKREFNNVEIDQSFAPGSEMSLRTRRKRENNPADSAPKSPAVQDDLVVSQIQKFVTQLQKNEKKAQEGQRKEDNAEVKDSLIKTAVKVSPVKDSAKADDVKKTGSLSDLIKDDGEVKNESKPAQIDSIVQKVKELAKKQMAKGDNKKKATSNIVKDKVMVKKNVKKTEQKKSEKDQVKKTASKEQNLVNGVGTVTLLTSLSANKDAPEEAIKMPMNPSLKPIPVRQSSPSVSQPQEEQEQVEVEEQSVIYSVDEAEEFVQSDFRCRGTFLMANDNKVCGSFLRSSDASNTAKEMLKDADRISLRSINDPQTSLRFAMTTQVTCRLITTTTTTTTESSTTSRFPLFPIAVPGSDSNSTALRLFGTLPYIFGWN